jgi:type I restriction enzyme S subunit
MNYTDTLDYDMLVSLSKQKFNPSEEMTDLRCIELEHIEQNTGRITGYVGALNQKSIKNKFNSNSILYGKLRPYLNKYALPNFEGCCSSEILVFEPKENNDRYYCYYLLQTKRFNQIVQNTTGSKMPRLNWSDISKVSFDVHNVDDQIKIGNLLSTMDKIRVAK